MVKKKRVIIFNKDIKKLEKPKIEPKIEEIDYDEIYIPPEQNSENIVIGVTEEIEPIESDFQKSLGEIFKNIPKYDKQICVKPDNTVKEIIQEPIITEKINEETFNEQFRDHIKDRQSGLNHTKINKKNEIKTNALTNIETSSTNTNAYVSNRTHMPISRNNSKLSSRR